MRYNQNMTTFEELQNTNHKFSYQNYSWLVDNNNLIISFSFSIEPDISFSPTLVIKNVTRDMIENLGKENVDRYVFNLGLAEMLSYWKSTASPIIEIKAGYLNQEQINWWHKLLIKGMGEYFFVNNINFTQENFVKIVCSSIVDDQLEKSEQSSSQVQSSENQDSQRLNSDRVTNILIPIGGGKDSAVSLEILETEMLRVNNLNIWSNSNQTSKAKQTGNSNQTSKAKQTGNSNQTGDSNQTGNSNGVFVVNPTRASLDLISAKKMQNVIIVDRSIDPKLIELNSQGYLNGHVPISSLFAFLSVFCADLFGFSHVAVSNERSSNEGNVQFFDHEINHQYSKTFEFETDFQDYSRKFLPADSPFYFSFLRPLYELQIAKIFSGNSDLNSGMKKYHHIFRSCNRGQKTNSWCGECSKCLFAYVILFPFMKSEEINSYFGKNMFDDLELWPIAQEILGAGAKKPLDCVGTHEETIVAFYLSIKKIQKSNQQLPALVEKINLGIISKEDNLDQRTNAILNAWNDENSLPKELVKVLKKYV
ncbi:MAG: hypothetical protein H6772_03885 [Pseudomonadales bacterium]|nr:hypothetical protein [Pseudomonadales bacterium]